MPGLLLFTLLGCTELVSGQVSGDVPNGASVVLLWPDANNLGRVGGVGEVNGSKFEIRANQPDNQHTGLEFGTLVLYDGEPARGETLSLDKIDRVVGAAPRHYIVDSNSTCNVGDGCDVDEDFERGMGCGECGDDGDCQPTNCKNVELIATDQPLALNWAVPDIETFEGQFNEDGTHVAWIDEREQAIQLFPIGGVGEIVFRTDGEMEAITGIHITGERVGARVLAGIGRQRGHVRDFDGANFLELDISGSTLLDGPLISPDGEYAAAIWSDEGLVVYDIDADTVVGSAPLGAGTWRADWSPSSQAAYAVPEPGGVPVAVPLPGVVPVDYPECSDTPGSSTVNPCSNGSAAVLAMTLGHPFLLPRPCTSLAYEDVPRTDTPAAVRECAPSGTGSGASTPTSR